MRFADKVVVVTGAGGGLGRALAKGFAGEGAQLVLTDVNDSLLEETAALLRAGGTVCSTHLVDVADESAIQTFGAEICRDHSRVDVLINNAGIAYGDIHQPMETLGQQRWLQYLSVNSVAPLLLGQALRPALAAAKGVILNQSSMASFVPANAYGITKATLNAMTYGMAHAFAADGIRVNAIAPGIMETPATRAEMPPETGERIRGMQLLRLHGMPEDIVSLALFLASEEARFMTCEVVSCDAGNRLRGWRY